jgi:hypothetical protein
MKVIDIRFFALRLSLPLTKQNFAKDHENGKILKAYKVGKKQKTSTERKRCSVQLDQKFFIWHMVI